MAEKFGSLHSPLDHTEWHEAGNLARKLPDGFIGKMGVLLRSTEKGEGAVPLAVRQLKLLEFLMIADGGRNVSRGRASKEESPAYDRKQCGLWVSRCFRGRPAAVRD